MLVRALFAASVLLASFALDANATPENDLIELRKFYMQRFPDVPLDAFRDGIYAIDPDARISGDSVEDFPPYEDQLKAGKKLFSKPFSNGGTYAKCFENGGVGIRQNYPYFDARSGEIITLEQEINECRKKNGESPLDLRKGDMASISAYMASTSNGKPMNIRIPQDSRALAWYEKGKQLFYQKRGQLNMSCANCHIDQVGHRLRGPMLSPALGQPARFPIYRGVWGEMGTLHWRYTQCQESVRAKAFAPQSAEYRALEYYQSFLSNGITVKAPGASR